MTELFKTEKVKISDLIPNEINPRKIKEIEKRKLWERLQKYGMIGIPVRDADGSLLSGHQRCSVYISYGFGDKEIDVRTAIRKLTAEEIREVMLIENTNAGEFDIDKLHAEFDEYVNLQDYGISFDDIMKDMDENEVNIEQPEYQIVPKFSEKYTSFVIVCTNEVDENNIAEKLGVGRMKCYKSSKIGLTHVITAKQFSELWNSK